MNCINVNYTAMKKIYQHPQALCVCIEHTAIIANSPEKPGIDTTPVEGDEEILVKGNNGGNTWDEEW